MQTPYHKTEDGFELQFGTNHLGHFALTGHLLETLLKTEGSRVVTTSSFMYILGNLDFNNLNWEKGKSYKSTGAYSRSKLANVLFGYELDRRLKENKSSTISVVAHPGYAATKLQSSGPGMGKNLFLRLNKWTYRITNRVVAQSAEMGALPIVMGATDSSLKGGEFLGPKRILRGFPKIAKSSKKTHDREVASRLWEVSEDLTGVNYRFD